MGETAQWIGMRVATLATLFAGMDLAVSTAWAGGWSLAQVIERARVAAPEVQLAQQQRAEAEAGRVGQGVILPTNPRLFGDVRYLTQEQKGSPADPRQGYLLGIDGTVEVGAAASARLAEADRRIAVAQAELDAIRMHIAAKAWLAWVELNIAEATEASALADVALQKRVQIASLERQRVGVAAEPEVSAVAVELATLQVQHLEAQRRREMARMALRQLLDLGSTQDVTLEGKLSDPPAPQPEKALVERAWAKRGELHVLRQRIALLQMTQKRLLREVIPRVGYNLGMDAAPASPVFGYLGLSIELPLAQRNQGPRAVNQAQQRTENWRLAAETRRIEREVMMARRSFEIRLVQLGVLTREALPNALKTQELVEIGWRAGRFDVFRLTTSTRELVRVRRKRLQTLLAAWADYIELERASGGLSQ